MKSTGKHISAEHNVAQNQQQRVKHECVDAFKRERDNFRRMKPELMKDPEYQDMFVAVHNNQIVAADKDRLSLDIEMSKEHKCGTFFIGKVYPKGK
jgi:hypothetical protein